MMMQPVDSMMMLPNCGMTRIEMSYTSGMADKKEFTSRYDWLTSEGYRQGQANPIDAKLITGTPCRGCGKPMRAEAWRLPDQRNPYRVFAVCECGQAEEW